MFHTTFVKNRHGSYQKEIKNVQLLKDDGRKPTAINHLRDFDNLKKCYQIISFMSSRKVVKLKMNFNIPVLIVMKITF